LYFFHAVDRIAIATTVATAVAAVPTGLTERFSRDFPDTYALADAPCGGRCVMLPDQRILAMMPICSPGLHRAFRLLNAHGLAASLRDGRVSFASAGDNLTVMVAGSVMQDPLEE
jgi:hypothetical protein